MQKKNKTSTHLYAAVVPSSKHENWAITWPLTTKVCSEWRPVTIIPCSPPPALTGVPGGQAHPTSALSWVDPNKIVGIFPEPFELWAYGRFMMSLWHQGVGLSQLCVHWLADGSWNSFLSVLHFVTCLIKGSCVAPKHCFSSLWCDRWIRLWTHFEHPWCASDILSLFRAWRGSATSDAIELRQLSADSWSQGSKRPYFTFLR